MQANNCRVIIHLFVQLTIFQKSLDLCHAIFLLFQALRLDNNRLVELNGLLTTQHHLQWLNVSYNSLQWFDYAFIPKSLQWLNLRGNVIEEMNNYYDIQSGYHLFHLDVSHNLLTRLDRESVVHSLKEVGPQSTAAVAFLDTRRLISSEH